MKTSDLLNDLPPESQEDLTPKIHELLGESKKTLVVLDDDPTGTQTVFDVPVLTALDSESIGAALDEAPPVLFLLTNSRALTPEETKMMSSRNSPRIPGGHHLALSLRLHPPRAFPT